jgi:hypothetical protein
MQSDAEHYGHSIESYLQVTSDITRFREFEFYFGRTTNRSTYGCTGQGSNLDQSSRDSLQLLKQYNPRDDGVYGFKSTTG